jgi:hypothetical protein
MNRSVGRVWRNRQLSCEELARFLLSCADRLGENAWYIVMRPDSLGFDRFAKQVVPNLVGHWPQGRVFSASLEIRWKRLSVGGVNDVLALTEDLEFEPAGFRRLGDEWRVPEKTYGFQENCHVLPAGGEGALRASTTAHPRERYNSCG